MNLSRLLSYRISTRGWGLLGGAALSILAWVLIWNYGLSPFIDWLF